MVFHFSIFFWSGAFFLVMRFMAASDQLSFWEAYLSSASLLAIISLVSAKKITRRIRNSFIPILISVSAPSLIAFIDSPAERYVFSLLSSAIFYMAFLGLYRLRFVPSDDTARAFLSIAALSALFFFYAGEYGFYLNFDVPLATLVIAFALGSCGAAYQTLYAALPQDRGRVFLYALAIGFGMGEVSWILSFWPFGYLTAGATALVIFFVLWDMALSFFLGSLSRKRTLAYLFVSLFLIGILIGTSPWRIQV